MVDKILGKKFKMKFRERFEMKFRKSSPRCYAKA